MPRGRSGGAAVADPAQRLPRADRPRGRGRHPPGRAGRPATRRRGERPRRRRARDDPVATPDPTSAPARQPVPADRSLRPRAGRPASRTSATATGAAASARVLRFLLFLFVLAGRRAGRHGDRRPAARARRSWSRGREDNPSALAARVRRGPRARGPWLGADATRPATTPTEIEFVVEPGDTPATLAPALEEAGIIASRARIPVRGARGRPRCRSSTPGASRSRST